VFVPKEIAIHYLNLANTIKNSLKKERQRDNKIKELD
jgi:hypothetical protein